MTICPRCTKILPERPLVDSIHTCTPTDLVRGLEAENAALKARPRGIGDSDIAALIAERDADKEELLSCRAILDNAGDHSTSIHGGINSLVSERHAAKEDARLCRGMVAAQEAMIRNALEPLGCLPPFDHHAAEWAADEIQALKQRVEELVHAFDDQFGTPCEQIRHTQEVEVLKAEAATLAQHLIWIRDGNHNSDPRSIAIDGLSGCPGGADYLFLLKEQNDALKREVADYERTNYQQAAQITAARAALALFDAAVKGELPSPDTTDYESPRLKPTRTVRLRINRAKALKGD